MPLDSDDDDAMTQAGDHHAWSERLLEFARGELEGARSEELETHFRSCADCRAELAALRALLEAPDEQMTDAERAELHGALQQKSQEAGNVVPLVARPSPERPFMSRLAPALGAAALLIIGGVAVLQGGFGGSSGDSGAAGGGAGGSEAAVESEAGAAMDARLSGTPVWLGDLGSTSLDSVAALTRSRSAVKSVRAAYLRAPSGDANQKQLELADVLAPQAPAELRSSLRSCIDEVSSQFGDARLLPAVGAQGRLEGREVLFVGFVTSSSGRRPDQLALWAFEPNSCAPLGYQASRLTGGP